MIINWAINPAITGKMNVAKKRITINFGLINAISSGMRLILHSAHAVTSATIGPMPAPDLSSDATIGSDA